MKNYLILDEDGYVVNSGYGVHLPPNGIEANIDLSNQPSPNHKFHYESAEWIDCTPNWFNKAEAQVKRRRLLAETDWTQLPDIPEVRRLKYQPYRQALRDITLQQGYPDSIVWPELPE